MPHRFRRPLLSCFAAAAGAKVAKRRLPHAACWTALHAPFRWTAWPAHAGCHPGRSCGLAAACRWRLGDRRNASALQLIRRCAALLWLGGLNVHGEAAVSAAAGPVGPPLIPGLIAIYRHAAYTPEAARSRRGGVSGCFIAAAAAWFRLRCAPAGRGSTCFQRGDPCRPLGGVLPAIPCRLSLPRLALAACSCRACCGHR